MSSNVFRVGGARVGRVVEWVGLLGTADVLFPQTPENAWQDIEDELAPIFWDPVSRRCRLAVQAWIVWVDGLIVIVDTGIGNNRERPQNPVFNRLSSQFDVALARIGVDRQRVDAVVNTHVHLDHVGWNTCWEKGAWSPMFPNARYFVNAADYAYFHPSNSAKRRAPRSPDEAARFEGMRLVVEDSILPIEASGQIVTWSDRHQLSQSLELCAAPGHTPGSSVLWLDDAAVFVGDLSHTPLQIHRPNDPCSYDLDPVAATASRRRVFGQAARRRAMVAPAHYPGRGAVSVLVDGDEYRPGNWAAVESI